MKMGMRNLHQSYAILLSVIIVDQVSKYFVRAMISPQSSSEYLGGFFRVEHAQNKGAFLSLGAGLESRMRFWIFTVLVAAFLAWAFWVLVRKTPRNRAPMDNMAATGLALVVAGGVGNLIDRVLFESVTDFLNLGLGPVRTGIFNVADMAIVAGILLLGGASFRTPGDSNLPEFKD